MYVNKKDIDTIAELSAYVAAAVESQDAENNDESNDRRNYWFDLEKRTNDLEKRMHRQFDRQS